MLGTGSTVLLVLYGCVLFKLQICVNACTTVRCGAVTEQQPAMGAIYQVYQV